MSPSLPTSRLLWVWSLPAFAFILSFLWFRKKRGSLKTDSRGAGEAPDDEACVESLASNPFDSDSGGILTSCINTSTESNEATGETEIVAENVARFVEETELETSAQDPKAEEEKQEFRKEETCAMKGKTEESIVKQIDAVDEANVKPVEIVEESIVQRKLEDLNSSETFFVIKPKKLEETPVGKGKYGNKKKKMKDKTLKLSVSDLDGLRKNDEETTACILEKKLAKLDLGNRNDRSDAKQTDDDVAERYSKNNSPSEGMLASPSVSGYSDTHSEGSSDSGKGCSEMLTPSRTPASGNSVSGDLPTTSIYEFVIPQQLVGKLIGRHGSNIHEIKEITHASIYIKKHPDTHKLKICAVEGTQIDIESALDMIRRKFPKKRYPNVTLEQVVISPEPQMFPIISENMQLYLIEGINNDVLLSSLVSAGHFFLQQPTHPTYLSLSRLNSCMAYCYSEPDQPTIPDGVGAGILCAAPVHNGWYRAQITNIDAESKICDVKFVDYGGYMTMPVSLLRQIRFDFVNLPFQAAECYLASVKPANEENIWCDEAKEVVEKLTFGKVLQAQVYGYAEDGVPLIYLYTVVGDEVILINEELVNLGYAEWIYTELIKVEEEEVDQPVESDIQESAPMTVVV